MTLLSVPNIPLLVQEKIDFYYYRDQWRKNIIKLHQQYASKVIINTDPTFKKSQSLVWINVKRQNMHVEEYGDRKFICPLYIDFYHTGKREDWNNPIRTFKKSYEINYINLPKRYFYSSGLNSIAGFKKSNFQKIPRIIP